MARGVTTCGLEFRYADNRPQRLDALARELVALQPAAALTVDHVALRALMRHTRPKGCC